MPIRVTAVEECDARDDDSSTTADKQIKKMRNHQLRIQQVIF